ncbi:hypothetical protein GW17_00041551 [Ensete ventricosum]|nr:hypothetical protein GW17_00041551 [Ensete ventricosum]
MSQPHASWPLEYYRGSWDAGEPAWSDEARDKVVCSSTDLGGWRGRKHCCLNLPEADRREASRTKRSHKHREERD